MSYWLFCFMVAVQNEKRLAHSTACVYKDAKRHHFLFAVFFAEFINTTRRINDALLSCIKRMA
jgi:hypothetical protein